MRWLKKLLIALSFCGLALTASTQTSTTTLKIAVFAPIYLDSVFENEVYKPGKNNFPKYILPGLDFYNGIMLAIDSLNKENAPIEVLFYDTKSEVASLDEIIADSAMQDVALIIASFNNRNEIKSLADFALEKKILLISATYPNDGGLTGNPYFVMLNPTLQAHIEAVYKFLHRNYPLENITLFRKKGNTEDMIQSILADMNKKTPGIPLQLKSVELTDSISIQQATDYLDSTKKNIVVCGTLDETFGIQLTKALSSSKSYKAIAVGMPTWDALREISNGLEVVYTTPYYFTRMDKLSLQLNEKYKIKYAGRPSDWVYKGFESMYHFTKLLLKYGVDFPNHLSEKSFKLFNDFDIQPVNTNKEIPGTDYLENKKLYIIRKIDGKIKSVN